MKTVYQTSNGMVIFDPSKRTTPPPKYFMTIFNFEFPNGIIDIVCPECKRATMAHEWKETSVGCECCGDHEAVECPYCEERFDPISDDDIFKKDNP